jgi:hypothetical protein
LPDLALLAEGLDDLEVLADGAWGATTLEAHEHEPIMRPMRPSILEYQNNRRRAARVRTTTFSSGHRFHVEQNRDFAQITSPSRDQTVENESD